MGRKKIIIALIVLVAVAAVAGVIELLPKRYEIAQTMPQAVVFWHDLPAQRAKTAEPGSEAFLFLSLNTTARSQDVLQRKLSHTKYGYLWVAFAGLGGYIDFAKQDVVAFRLASDGKLDRFPLADHSTVYGSWSLADGRIQLTAPPSMRDMVGFRWDGSKFVSVSRPPQSQVKTEVAVKLNADDEEEDGDPYSRFLSAATRQQFKSAGWHYKFLTGYTRDAAVTLPITLERNTFHLVVESAPFPTDGGADFEFATAGTKSVTLSGDKLSPQILFSQSGWQMVSKNDYARLRQQSGMPGYQPRLAWLWLAAALFLVLFRFAGLFHVFSAFGGVKRHVLKNMATSYSFPPATPAQFPSLDVATLDRYTRELEGMGFTRLLDCSPTSDAPNHPAHFSRIFTHSRHHCWAVLNQLFPRGKPSVSLKCSVEGCLQNGWTLSFSDRKPAPAASLMRRKKALRVSMPEATTSELLQGFLKMRDEVCVDLGISPLSDDSLEAYIQWNQRAIGELRQAVQEKSFVRGLPEVYFRRFALLRTKPEYIWLGDYPKEAERRKQGFSSFATDAG